MRLKLMSLATALVVAFGVQAYASETLKEYGLQCREKIGYIPDFNCQDPGLSEVVPITVNGQTPETYEWGMSCDRPSLLPYGDETFGQCTPYSRVLDLSRKSSPDLQANDIQISAFCRRKFYRDEESSVFDEVDIILHDTKTGSTCWFHADGEGAEGLPGKVPSPTGNKEGVFAPNVSTFWKSPEYTASLNCGGCHDSDPFMYSPYIGQVWHRVPVNPFGWYANDIGTAFQDWEKPSALSTTNNTCVGCHRIGNQYTCETGIYESAGQIPPVGGSDAALSYPLSHWMPADNFHSQSEWESVYAESVAKLGECCKDPYLAQCKVTPITGLPKWTQ